MPSLVLKNNFMNDAWLVATIRRGPLEFISRGESGGFFRFPISPGLKNHIIKNNLYSLECDPYEKNAYAKFDAGPAFGLMATIGFDEKADKSIKGLGASYELLRSFAQTLGIPIAVRIERWHRLDEMPDYQISGPAIQPNETLSERRKLLARAVSSINSIFTADQNVVKALPYGSWTYGNPMPGDIDFIVIVRDEKAYKQARLRLIHAPIAFVPHIACKKPNEDDYENLRVDPILSNKTVAALEYYVKSLNLILDAALITERTFAEPRCCTYHIDTIAAHKEEYGKFWSTLAI